MRAVQSGAPWADFRRMWSRAAGTFENILKPLAVPATGGILTALVAFVLIVQNILVGVPMGGIVPNDLPLNLVQPARLESLAPFPVPGVVGSAAHSESGELLLRRRVQLAQQDRRLGRPAPDRELRHRRVGIERRGGDLLLARLERRDDRLPDDGLPAMRRRRGRHLLDGGRDVLLQR